MKVLSHSLVKYVWFICLISVTLLLVVFLIGGHITDKDVLIEKVELALNDNDAAALSRLLTSTDNRLKINEENAQILLDYLNKYPDYKQTLITILYEQARFYEGNQSKDLKPIAGTFFSLKKTEHAILRDTYAIEVKPVYITIHTNSKKATLSVNGQEVVKANEPSIKKTVGPFLPGEYDVVAKLKKAKQKKTITLWNEHEVVVMNL